MPPTLTEALDSMYTTTFQARKKKIVDQVFTATPFWYLLQKAGNIQSQDGGRWVEIPLSYAKNETVTFIAKGGTVSLAATDHLTVVQMPWRMAVVNVTRFWADELQNRGKSAIINKVNTDISNARDSLINEFEVTLFGDGSGHSGNAFGGLQEFVAEDPSTGTVGGIDRAVDTWWRNQAKDMSGEAASVYLIKRMRTMFNDCGKGTGVNRFPTVMICAQDVHELYEDEALELYRISDTKLGDLGFGNTAFKSRPITWAEECTAGSLYFLNMNDIKFVVNPAANFHMTKWKEVANQIEDRFAQLVVYGNIMFGNCRRQGVLFDIAE